jgi:thiosulfate/3-mercaptopyruvate sulfurtransferase
MSLVDTEWLTKEIDRVKIIDSSWHLPQTNRDGYSEYKKGHIKNSIFFDIDKYSKKNIELPHMLVDKNDWGTIVSNMGISNNDEIVIYDNSDVLSACRCWYNFIYFGHDSKLVHVLNGGLQKWKCEKKDTTQNVKVIKKTNYLCDENKNLVKNLKQIKKNIIFENFKIVDARSRERFEGKAKEPREGLRSGSIPNSKCLPFREIINIDNTFKSVDEIREIFREKIKDVEVSNVVFSCGSGVTACVLALAYSLINVKYMPTIYDGSWAEFGKD